jgi:hypothetical protein
MRLEWARSLRDQCLSAGVAFFLKQWGEWGPMMTTGPHGKLPYSEGMVRFGKKRAGRLLDFRTWDEFPEAADAARRRGLQRRCVSGARRRRLFYFPENKGGPTG